MKSRETMTFDFISKLARETRGSPQYVAHLTMDLVQSYAARVIEKSYNRAARSIKDRDAPRLERQIREQVKQLRDVTLNEKLLGHATTTPADEDDEVPAIEAPPTRPASGARTRRMTREEQRIAAMRERLGLPATRARVDGEVQS